MKSKTPKPRQGKTPIATAQMKTINVALCLDQPSLSLKIETIVSISEIADVNAANKTNMKNTVPITLPKGMLSKTLGNVTNISDGPFPRAALSPPEKANTAGIIVNPARNAIAVSKISICLTELSRLFSFFI